jgi:hypothetical protein
VEVGAEAEVVAGMDKTEAGAEASPPWLELGGRRWGRFSMELVEVRHRIAPCGLLRDRVFTVLLVTATVAGGAAAGTAAMASEAAARTAATSSEAAARTATAAAEAAATSEDLAQNEFIVVSVPVRDADAIPGTELSRARAVVVGAYASIERFRLMTTTTSSSPSSSASASESDGHACSKREIEWIMATASDAKGVLPPWLQARAVPGQISKDVGLFVGWIEQCRRGDGAGEKGRWTGRKGVKRILAGIRRPAGRRTVGYNSLEGEIGEDS